MKKKDPSEKQSICYAVRFTEAEAKLLTTLARQQKVSVAKIIRSGVIDKYL